MTENDWKRFRELEEKVADIILKQNRDFLDELPIEEKVEYLTLYRESRGQCLMCGYGTGKCQCNYKNIA